MYERAVLKTYKEAAKKREIKLCCPVNYQRPELLKIIPKEILEKDYGCGDPTVYVKEGEIVVDLGCGSGKHCYMIAQIVGPKGKVIGIDFNDEMLHLARKYQKEIAEKLGYFNTEFRKAKIQNLRLDLEKVDKFLQENPIHNFEDLLKLEEYIEYLEKNEPLIPDNSIDTVVSNCVLNLVKSADKETLFKEIYRVLKPGGRAVISDIVSDEDIPEHLKADPELWAGCISGAMREDEFISAFIKAGFTGIRILKYEKEPWQVIEDIEFRSITIEAFKGKKGDCLDAGQAVIYLGPFKLIEDFEGHVFEIGKRVAVCERTFQNLKNFFQDHFIFIEPSKELIKKPFPSGEKIIYRSPKTTKKGIWHDNLKSASSCIVNFMSFEQKIKEVGKNLVKREIKTLQINVGYKCHEKCLHCHISASKDGKIMNEEIMQACVELLKANPSLKVDITGGSPELHPHIDKFLLKIAPLASEIYFRTNLIALSEKQELLDIFKAIKIKVIASFPGFEAESVNQLRGQKYFERALEALVSLSKGGLGSEIPLYVMVNPYNLSLVPKEEDLKEDYEKFFKKYNLKLSGLFVLNNFPIGRFEQYLKKENKLNEYYELLYANFNPKTLDQLMCLDLLNISPEGYIYDCDFNQALNLKIEAPSHIFELLTEGLDSLKGKKILIGNHCYGCTASYGCGCFGSLT